MAPSRAVASMATRASGTIHSVVFGGFAAHELATRINDAQPKAIVAASCGLEPGRVIEYKPLVDAAIDEATHKPDTTIVLQREQAPG
ncbi:propionyl-CoA synthetase, partial [Croceibacter atlanticus]|nr:propionyl-CoA synthetase [Croceibacter atlanticus]